MMNQNQKRIEWEIVNHFLQYTRLFFLIYANHALLNIIPFLELQDIFNRSDLVKDGSPLRCLDVSSDNLNY